MLAVLTVLVSGQAPTIADMVNDYSTIFPSSNRNAASHLWSSWILSRSASTTADEMMALFGGFCPVSGSPVHPSPYNKYLYSLPLVSGGMAHGTMHHCCNPCVCDTTDAIVADTKTVALAGGVRQQFTFAVIGDPCLHPEALARPYADAFMGTQTTLSSQAPEVVCDGGRLRGE